MGILSLTGNHFILLIFLYDYQVILGYFVKGFFLILFLYSRTPLVIYSLNKSVWHKSATVNINAKQKKKILQLKRSEGIPSQ